MPEYFSEDDQFPMATPNSSQTRVFTSRTATCLVCQYLSTVLGSWSIELLIDLELLLPLTSSDNHRVCPEGGGGALVTGIRDLACTAQRCCVSHGGREHATL